MSNHPMDSYLEHLRNTLRADSQHRFRLIAGGSKMLVRTSPSVDMPLDLSPLSGIVDYDPSEFTLTTYAGTPVGEVRDALAERGQYLPFDPPRVEFGATMGGMTATGIAGPSRMRFGGVRDFILGIKFFDGEGNRISGGGKVVKNASGFDLPKLMVGSWGTLGAITEVTYKVFPKPEASRTIRLRGLEPKQFMVHYRQLAKMAMEIDALDLEPMEKVLDVRISGSCSAIDTITNRLVIELQRFGVDRSNIDHLEGVQERTLWQPLLDWQWHQPDTSFLRVPISLRMVEELDRWLEVLAIRRRYSCAGNVAWIEWPKQHSMGLLNEKLITENLRGRVLAGDLAGRQLGIDRTGSYSQRIRDALYAHRWSQERWTTTFGTP